MPDPQTESLLNLLAVQLAPRTEWFPAVEFRSGTLARAVDVMEMQNRIRQGIGDFGTEVDRAMTRLVEALIAQLISIKVAQDLFQAFITAQIAAFEAALTAEIRATLIQLGLDIAAIKTYVDDKVAALRTALQAYCNDKYDTFLALSKKYTDSRYSAILRILKAVQYKTITFATQVEDTIDYTDNPQFDQSIYRPDPDHRYYIHSYVYSVSFVSKAGITETGHTITTTVNQLGIQQVDEGTGSQAEGDTPLLILGPSQSLNGHMSVNGGIWRWSITLTGYLVPRGLWAFWDTL